MLICLTKWKCYQPSWFVRQEWKAINQAGLFVRTRMEMLQPSWFVRQEQEMLCSDWFVRQEYQPSWFVRQELTNQINLFDKNGNQIDLFDKNGMLLTKLCSTRMEMSGQEWKCQSTKLVRQEWKCLTTNALSDKKKTKLNKNVCSTRMENQLLVCSTRMETKLTKLTVRTRMDNEWKLTKLVNQAGLFDKNVEMLSTKLVCSTHGKCYQLLAYCRQEWKCYQPSWFVQTRMEMLLTKLVTRIV
ncbi:Hypothetical_protein [Hexamita inflata]|uniref:Hypothetical_protein n=1 Tax=Hexamita inflata TaxID=28002 RepID=A0AA86RAE8_9EUKA|nr:Hypothetical protein HINF_LOCUS56977 [Hexamita inflata]